MDSTRTALFNAILLKPHDIAPRLVYADWLIENNGEFGQWRGNEVIKAIESGSEKIVCNTWIHCHWQGTERNGFVDTIEITIADFMTYSQDISIVHPITQWHIIDVIPTFANDDIRHAMYGIYDRKIDSREAVYEIPIELAEIMLNFGHQKNRFGMIQFDNKDKAVKALSTACFQYARIPLLKKFGVGTLCD